MKRCFLITLILLSISGKDFVSARETTINDNKLINESVDLYTARCSNCGSIAKADCEYTAWNIDAEKTCIHGYAWGMDVDICRVKKDNIYCKHCGKTDKEEIVQNKFECHGYNR